MNGFPIISQVADNIDALVRDLTHCIPDLQVQSARLHTTDGQSNDVLFVNESLVFRFPRTEVIASTFRAQVTALKSLASRLPLPIPTPLYQALDRSQCNQIFFGYTRLTGVPMHHEILFALDAPARNRIADQLAQFLKTLHNTPADHAGVSLPVYDTREGWQTMLQDFRRHLFSHMRPDARDEVAHTFETALNDPHQFDFTPALRHGDFGGSNILIDPINGNATGILDFDDLGMGDPAVDASAILYTGEAFFERMCGTYPALADYRRRADFICSTFALQEALYGVLAGNEDAFESGIAKYR
jgi:aminoglycoside 2''-phosphotransferase